MCFATVREPAYAYNVGADYRYSSVRFESRSYYREVREWQRHDHVEPQWHQLREHMHRPLSESNNGYPDRNSLWRFVVRWLQWRLHIEFVDMSVYDLAAHHRYR